MSSSKSKVIVTIEGSVTPSVVLARGARRTVVLTDKVQKLIDRGFVVVVDRQEIPPVRKAAAVKPATTVTVPSFDNG